MFSRILLIACLFVSINMFGQYKFESQKVTLKKGATFNVSEVKQDFFPQLINLEAPHPDGNSYRDYLESVKAKIGPYKEVVQAKKTSETNQPLVGQGFTANAESGNPNDNDMAISNDGWLISVINSSVYMTNVEDASITPIEVSLEEFSAALGEYDRAFDPKVEYDPIADRFVLMFLDDLNEGSAVVVAFSQTNNPTEGWNLYQITGNPFNEAVWTDFPMIALTEDDFFLTVNLIFNNQSWEAGFVETIVWQVDKASAYAGEDIESKLWSQTDFAGQPIRNAIPVQGGSGLAGPNLFLLSNRNFDAENDSIFLMEITGNSADESAEFLVEVLESPVPYGAPPNARQVAGRMLQTNDARILGAYYENNRIHFVGMTNDFDTNTPAIYHGIINEPNFSNFIEANVISGDLDYGYPNLSFSGQFPDDEQFILNLSYTSETERAGHAVIQYNFGDYSDLLILKEGERHIGPQLPTPAPQRWGDYSGSQPRYNQLGTVWTSGTYGYSSGNPDLSRATWVGELTSQIENSVGIDEISALEKSTQVFPNPVREMVSVEFELEESKMLKFQLIDSNGRIIKDILHGRTKAGKNLFNFSVHTLAAGTYFLNILEDDNQPIFSKKIIVK